jgi:hypothetical protein
MSSEPFTTQTAASTEPVVESERGMLIAMLVMVLVGAVSMLVMIS